jgi:hypothetical protein
MDGELPVIKKLLVELREDQVRTIFSNNKTQIQMRCENRAVRLANLINMDAPKTIIDKEIQLFMEAIEAYNRKMLQ